MNAPALADVQNAEDQRRLAIDKVGSKAIRHPVRVRDCRSIDTAA
ncbi:GTP cyclohydrolase, FolE2/MptA family [Denitromonas iodatirespirans]